ncbi:MAG: Fe-S cluster assembly sulfur transfer protein SufU [Halobacteriaceae archaeon]
MGSDMYRQQILDHYKNPRNYGELAAPTFTHEGHNSSCGDDLRFEVALGADEETIEDVAFTGEGCAISQASASMFSEAIKGESVDEVMAMDRDDVLDLLGVEVTPMRVKCAVLAEKVIQDGVELYRSGETPAEAPETTTED